MTRRILVLDGISERGLQLLQESPELEIVVRDRLSLAELMEQVGGFDGLIVRSATRVTAEVLQRGVPRLQVVGRAGVGVDNIDVQAASRLGVLVMNTPAGNAVTTAEHTLALLCSLARHIPQASASVKAGRWEKKRFGGRELEGKYLGVIGLGHVGRVVAERARGLRMRVLGHDPFVGGDVVARLGVELVSLEELYHRADIITVHTPLTDETRGMIGAAAFGKMKPGMLLINAAAGGVVDERALVHALRAGTVAGCALDVFETEPPPADHPLLGMDQVICTPHLGASTEEAQEKVGVEIAELMLAFFESGEVRNAVNAPAIGREVVPRVAPYLDLATRLGSLLGQLSSRSRAQLAEITVELTGEPAELAPVAVVDSALAAVLERHLGMAVNAVNARPVAADRQVTVTEIRRARAAQLASAVTLSVRGPDQAWQVQGTVLPGGPGGPRLLRYGEFPIEAVPEGQLLLLAARDQPGVTGAVGRLLDDHRVTVWRMQVGRTDGQSLFMWNVSQPLGAELLAELRRLPQITWADQVSL
jgi:D-3-phosphoglycerate dehydrogenase